MSENYYEILGVTKTSSEKEIRQAYRRLARKYHPDLHPGDESAESYFKKINEANEVLSNKENRDKYDQFGDNWQYADQFGKRHKGGKYSWGSNNSTGYYRGPSITLEDIFGEFMNPDKGVKNTRSSVRNISAKKTVEINLIDAFRGTTRIINFRNQTQSNNRSIEVTIPPGVDNGSKIRVKSKDGKDNIYVITTIIPDSNFKRVGDDLFTNKKIGLLDAVLGCEVEIETISDKVLLKIPGETQNGTSFRLSGKGMPLLKSPGKRGSMYVTIDVKTPTNVSDEEKELFMKLKSIQRGKE